MRKTNVILFLSLIFFFVACNNNKEKVNLSPKEQNLKDISTAEKKLYAETEADRDKAIAMIDMYISFADEYPQDTLSPEYLFRASEIAMNFDQPHNAVRFLTRIEDNYTDFSKYASSLFMKAMIYHYNIQDLAKAKEYYNIYIEKYPDHTFVKDAKGALMFIDLNDEQLIDLFKDINKYN